MAFQLDDKPGVLAGKVPAYIKVVELHINLPGKFAQVVCGYYLSKADADAGAEPYRTIPVNLTPVDPPTFDEIITPDLVKQIRGIVYPFLKERGAFEGALDV